MSQANPTPSERSGRLWIHAGIGIGVLLASSAALAQTPRTYPTKPITMIVAGGPSTTMDREIRLYANSILQSSGTQLLIDYKGGAGGTIGAAYVAKATPDGYTAMTTISSYTTSPALYANLPFDSIKDLAPVSQLTDHVYVLVVRPSLPFKTVGEYLAYAKANPGKLNFATSGQGSSFHMGGALLHYMTGTEVTFVHYKTGTQRQVDFLAGRTDVQFATPATLAVQGKAGRMRGLGISTLNRLEALPDMPTISEQGVKDYKFSGWTGVLMPGRTSPAIVGQLNSLFVQVGKDSAVVKKLESDEAIMVNSTPAEFAKLIAAETSGWRQLVKAANIKLEDE